MTLDARALTVALEALLEVPDRLAAFERRFASVESQLSSLVTALPPLLVPVTEAAAALKVSVPTMRRWVRAGAVPVVRVGNTIRVDLSRLSPKTTPGVASQRVICGKGSHG